MKHICFKALLVRRGRWVKCPRAKRLSRGKWRMALLISKSGTRMLLQVAIMFFPAVAPLAAQGIPPNPASAQTNSSPLADTAAPSSEALVWRSQLHPVNTTHPPRYQPCSPQYLRRLLDERGKSP